VFGYGRGSSLGQSIEVLVPESFRGRHQRQRTEYQRAPTTRPMGAGQDLWARRRDGTVLPVEISLSPIAETVRPVIVAIIRDITERKRARTRSSASGSRVRAIFNATYQFIGLMSPDGILLEANQSALDLAGVAAER
jgi:PAS domain S-box-containing protein